MYYRLKEPYAFRGWKNRPHAIRAEYGDRVLMPPSFFRYEDFRYFIILGSFLVLNLFNLPKKEEMTEKEWKRSRTIMILNSLIVIIPAILFSLYRLLH
jgi:hypothetical protein